MDTVTAPPQRSRRRSFRGWHMVWVLAGTETVAYGALYYAFAVFLVPMREAFATSAVALTGAFSLAIAVSGIAAPFVGRWLDGHGARPVMTVGSALATAALIGWSMAANLLQLYACFFGMGIAWAMVLYEPAFVLINRWFVRQRSSALLTLTVVGGLASAIFLPVTQLLIDEFGWRRALVVLAVVVGACGLLHFGVLRGSPRDVGLTPDNDPLPILTATEPGVPVETSATSTARTTSLEVRQSWRRPDVRWLTVATVAETSAVTMISVHLVTYLFDTGTPLTAAATAAGALGLLSVTGRILLTGAAQRWGMARVSACMVALQSVGVVALPLLPGPVGVIVFVIFFGAGFGVMTLARAALLGGYVPQRVFGRVSGRQTFVVNASRVAAPVIVGATVAWTGSYTLLLASVAGCTLLAGVGLWRADSAHRKAAS